MPQKSAGASDDETSMLPCPICGSKPEILRGLTRKRVRQDWKESQYTSVRCSNSGCIIWRRDIAEHADLCLDDRDAAKAWNREVRMLLRPKQRPPQQR